MLIQNVTLIRTGIEVIRSAAAKKVAIIDAEANANATITANTAQAKIIKNTVTKQSEAYYQA